MPKLTVICRHPSKAMDDQVCELTCIERVPISFDVVKKQHDAYVQVFKDMIKEGYNIELKELPAIDTLADSIFVEDTTLMYNNCAVFTRPGVASRQPEVDYIIDVVKSVRSDTYRVVDPGTVDGGDVLYVPNSKYVFCGKSARTNDAGFAQLSEYLGKHGLECVQCLTTGCLHIKCGATALSDTTVLVDRRDIDPSIFTSRGFRVIEVDPSEKENGNVLTFVAEKDNKPLRTIIRAEAFPVTGALIDAFAREETAAGRPTRVVVLNVDEVAKAEGAITCCSLLSYN